MKGAGLALVLVLAGGTAALADRGRAGGIPQLDYAKTCRETPPVAMDRKQQLQSCLNDEKQAKLDLPAQWQRSKAEWRSSCLRQTTLGGLASYVELLTCLEMHDPNPPSLNRQSAAQPGSASPKGRVAPPPSVTPPPN